MKEKTDRRVKYTKMILRDSLLDLVDKKPLNQVTISELCREADINRNTFYNHYNAPYEIFHEIEDELFEGLKKEIEKTKDLKTILLASCKSLEQNKKMSRLIFSDVNNSRILSKIISSFKNVSSENYNNITSEPQKSFARYVYIFGERGTISIIQDWVNNGFNQPAEVIADFISSILENLNQSFKLKKLNF